MKVQIHRYIYIYITFFIVPAINEYMIMNTLLFIKLD